MTQDEWDACDDPKAMLDAVAGAASARRLRLFACACCRRVWPLLGDPRSRAAVEAAERFADGQLDLATLQAVADAAEEAGEELEPSHEDNGGWGHSIRHSAADPAKAARAAWLAAWEGSRSPGFRADTDPMLAVIDAAGDCVAAAGWHAAADADRVCQENFEKAAIEARWEAIRRTIEARDAGCDAERRAQATLIRDIFGDTTGAHTLDPNWRTSTVTLLASGMYEARDFSAMPILADALQDARCDSTEILDHCRDVNALHVRGCWVVDRIIGTG